MREQRAFLPLDKLDERNTENINDHKNVEDEESSIPLSSKSRKLVSIPTDSGIHFVSILDIIRCEGINKYTLICLANGAKIVSSYSIGFFDTKFEKLSFFRTHKSHLVNSIHFLHYQNDGTLTLRDKSTVPVSTRKRQLFLDFVKKFV